MATDELKPHEAVLRTLEVRKQDLQRQIAASQAQLKQIHVTMVNIQQLFQAETTNGGPPESWFNVGYRPEAHKYSHLSVRWAILCLLSESPDPLTPQEIADALQAGGIETKAKDFTNNVSAVLSQMKAKDEPEVEVQDGKWRITQTGRSAWTYIRTRKLRRFSGFAETPDVLASGAPH